MHCGLQKIGNDSSKVSEAGKEVSEPGKDVSTSYQQRNKSTSLEITKDCEESSVSRIHSDSRCATAILTIYNIGPDGNWRVVAIPVQFLNHVNLASGTNMDGVQLLFPPPLNRLKIDQCTGPKGHLPPYAYPVKSFTRRTVTSSNARRVCQNKTANKASKQNELAGSSCRRSSLDRSPSSFSDSSAAVISSDNFTGKTKEDKSLKKNSRKRSRKKVKQSKKQTGDSGSLEREVLTEEYVSVSLTSEAGSSYDADKEVGSMLYATTPELSSSDDRLVKCDCESNEMNGNINVTEASTSCNSSIDETTISKATAQNSDVETKDIQHVELCCLKDIQDSLVLDSVSLGSGSDESTNAGDIGKQSNKASCRTTSIFGDGYFHSRNDHEHKERIRHGSQNCIGNDKRVKQKQSMSKSSSFNKFGGVGVLHGRTGKENSHSVWQKVQKNSSDECGGELKKVNTTLSQFVSTAEKDSSVVKNRSPVSANVVSEPEDKKHLKNKVGGRSKGKMDPVSKKGHGNYSTKVSHFNRAVLNDNVNVGVQQNDTLHISSQEANQQGLNSFSGFNSEIKCLTNKFQTNGVEHETSEGVHSAQFHLKESYIQTRACHNIANSENEGIDIQNTSLVMQHPVPCNLFVEVGQTVKEVSSGDFNVQNHSYGATLWKWIPKKGTGLAKSESNSSSPECSDEPPSKNFNLESSIEPKIDSFSEDQESSLNASSKGKGQIYCEVSCINDRENLESGNGVADSLTKHMGKHEIAHRMNYECENQDMSENDSYRIARAVNDACNAQQACEAVHMATGGPVAEFEMLLHCCSPVICQSPNSPSCLTCSQNHGGVSLCRHEMPALSLGYLWQWYEEHGSYGLEIRAQEYENLKKLGGVGQFPFRAYFSSSLSAVQLFKNREHQCASSSDDLPNCKVSEACQMIDISEHSIFSVPQPHDQDANIQIPKKTASMNSASNPSINSACSGDLELLFEYFEDEPPQQRRPLYEKIQELVRGDVPIQSKIYGDPTNLNSVNLRDLHPRSWYSVAWYPIYRIPEGNFRAAFLTYHSLGHLVRRSTNSDLQTVDSCIVSPAVGLQSYNAKGECWFQLSHSALEAEMLGMNPSFILKERLRTLEETASLMARAVVNKGNQICTNNHPDFEFFMSRRRY
ncbi:uncharacterized protein LOC130738608 isoform X2 [Lotus japonicus]|nr:uncharacterized protein LOC130738608 isoform X2 [Lotus japonicus]XP_057446657.1 uncharacterized protein LOC130738608 isoform X2 [Lotus japonicus]